MEEEGKPSITVDSIVLDDGEIALVNRKYRPLGWGIPGGYVEYDEKLKEACRREVREETGLEVEIVETERPSGEFGIYDDPERDPRKRVITVVFVCKVSGGELRPGDEAKEVKTLPVDEALQMDLIADHRKILLDFKENFL